MTFLSKIRYALVVLVLCALSGQTTAGLMNYEIDWNGTSGYSGNGSFSFDDTSVGGDNLITEVDLLNFDFSFYDPSSSLLKTYGLSGAVSFDFETDTEAVRVGAGIGTLYIGALSPSDYILLGGNGCTGDTLVLYQGDGGCASPNTFFDKDGVIRITRASSVPEPASFTLLGLGFAGLLLSRRRCKA